MDQTPVSDAGKQLQQQLATALQQARAWQAKDETETKVHVAGVGATLSTAYEQLRNAAEYTEEHLLLQRTIRRFYKRNLSFFDRHATKSIGEELIIELTQSGYLKNDTVPVSYIQEIEALVTGYYEVYWQLRKHHISIDRGSEWVLDILSVGSEAIFNKAESLKVTVFADFAYYHYYSQFRKVSDSVDSEYGLTLYAAVHRALLKSDKAVVRSTLLNRHTQGFSDIREFIAFQKDIDKFFVGRDTERLIRLINKNGAPLRILKRLMAEYPEMILRIEDRTSFLSAYQSQTEKEYKTIAKKINRGVIKSIIFLLITKVIIGFAIEIPYDLYFYGSIIWLPLVINLLFPPFFMAILRLTMKMPGTANTNALKKYVDELFYSQEERYEISARVKTQSSVMLNIIYATMFLSVFGLVSIRLVLWDFSWLHIAIFFVFLSTASFLGFRLSRLIRELEVVSTNQGGVAIVRDFLYMPFIFVGRWLSDKYSRINIIALVLDMAIELPLKTFLRLLRQWTQFLNDKKDEL